MDFIRIDDAGNREGFRLPEFKKIVPEADDASDNSNKVLPLVEDNFYITSGGTEYIKMGSTELWYFIQSCIALEQLDTEPGFYGLSIYIAKNNPSGGSDLHPFAYFGQRSTVANLCELAGSGEYNEDTYRNIVLELKITA